MRAVRKKSIRHGQRGQIMILGALGILLVALMMLLTLNVVQSVFEKIRIQQLSDASAFSIATQQARAFNFFAYTNRANVGSLVAAASAHGFMSMATAVADMFEAAETNFAIMMGIEAAICPTCCNPKCCCKTCKHCKHAWKDFKSWRKYRKARKKFEKAVKNKLDKKFIQAIRMLDLHMQYISLGQLEMKMRVGMQIMSDTLTKKLRDEFAPQASNNAMGVTGLNLAEFGKVFESKKEKKRWVPTEIANASRWKKFVYKRKFPTYPYLFVFVTTLTDFISQKYPKPSKGQSIPLFHKGEGRIIKNASNPKKEIKKKQAGPDGDAAAAADEGWVLSRAFELVMIWKYKAEIGSDKNTSQHKPKRYCTGVSKHKNFKCLAGGNCFTLFKAEPKASKDFGQPKVYTLISQDLRMMPQGGKGPWEITDKGEISVDLGGDVGKKKMQISDNPAKFGKGMAMSKAMVYYHLPTDWKEHPNFFNPFWRAKLQPFRGSSEAIKVLSLGGAGKYIPALLAGAPLP